MGSLDDLFRQAKAMQEKLAAAQEDLKRQLVTGASGGGMVTVTVTGGLEVKSVHIDPAAVDPEDVGMLEDLVQAAANDALARARDLMKNEFGALAGGLSIPGLF